MVLTGLVTNIQRFSTEDGPGIRTTVFLKGCPLSCLWCHNIENISPRPQTVWYSTRCIGDKACIEACPEGALELLGDGMHVDREKCKACGTCEDACPSGAIKVMGNEWRSDALVEELLRDRVFFSTSGGGITFSGGEPTQQADFVIEVAKGLKAQGIHIALDTCGYCSEAILNKTLSAVDLVLYDLKVMNPDAHLKYTGVPLGRVLSNAKFVGTSGVAVWIRTPVIPGHTDEVDNIRQIARFILQNVPNIQRWDLLAFNRMCVEKYSLFGLEYPLKDAELIPAEKMDELASIARGEGIDCVHWSGMTRRPKTEEQQHVSVKEVGACGETCR